MCSASPTPGRARRSQCGGQGIDSHHVQVAVIEDHHFSGLIELEALRHLLKGVAVDRGDCCRAVIFHPYLGQSRGPEREFLP